MAFLFEARGALEKLKLLEKGNILMPKSKKDRLVILIDHWIRHNCEHTSEYLRVAERLESAGLPEVAGGIRKASDLVVQANDSLCVAKDALAHN